MASSRMTFGKTSRRFAASSCSRWSAVLVVNFFTLSVVAAYMVTGKSTHDAHAQAEGVVREATALRSRMDWEHEEMPDFCHEIVQRPQPHRKNCVNASIIKGAPKCDPNNAMMFSQYGEDYYLYTRHFAKQKKPGLYLDIATNDAIAISNTYFMDRCLGWKGICVEANPKYYERIHRERSCALVPTCVSDKDGSTVEFAMSGPGSGIVSTHRQGAQIKERAVAVVKKKCVSIMPQLERYGVKEIDYLNLDVEGHEMDILRSFDFDSVTIKVISIEISSKTQDEIHEFLGAKGFERVDNEKASGDMEGMPIYPSNEFYVHESVVFGEPEKV